MRSYLSVNDMDSEDAEHRDLEKRVQAQLQVEAFVTLMEHRLRVTEDEVFEFIELLRWLKLLRTNTAKMRTYTAIAVVGLAITGLWNTLGEGLKSIFHR